MKSIIRLYHHTIVPLLLPLHDVVLLLLRLYVAKIFFFSGLTKIDSWDSTLLLFEYEYAVPLLPVAFAAYSATFFELVMPPLLALGLFTRFAAVPLLVMTAVIELTFQSHAQHIFWALALATFITYGAGRLSLDYMAKRCCMKKFGCQPSCCDEKKSCSSQETTEGEAAR